MRVLLVCDWFLKVVEGQAIALCEQGNAVTLLTRDHAREYADDSVERTGAVHRLRENGVTILELPGSRRSWGSFWAFRRHVRNTHPDVVHVHENFDPRLFALVRRFPVVYTIHDPTPHVGAVRRSLAERATQYLWRRQAAHLVVHGNRLRDELQTVSPRAVIDIAHLGITVRTKPFPIPSTKAILFFGRLEPYKGLKDLIEAMRILWSLQPETRLLIYGSGPEKHVLPADSRIDLHARYVPEEELDAMFALATVAVLPYVEASQSAAGLEAISRGVPVVVTDVGSLREIPLDDSYVVPAHDPTALAAALERALDHDLSLRWRFLEHAKRNFSWNAVASRYEEIYQEASTGSHGFDLKRIG